MRVAVSRRDPGYVYDPQNYKVFLDGEQIDLAVVADSDLGYVVVIDPESFEPTLNECRRNKIKGSVEIIYQGSKTT